MEAVESFAAFYRREFPAMTRLAAAVTANHLMAEDIAQEALTRAHRKWAQIAGYDMPGAWVRRVTINLSLSARNRALNEARARIRLGPPATIPPPAEPHEEVWKAVSRLPGKQRAAIALHYLEDQSITQIAATLGCSEATAKVHLYRGRQALFTMLEPRS